LTRKLWASHGATVLLVTHDIDEAVYLGERVLVLSRSPTRVLEDLAIDLGAERDQLATRSSQRFAALRARVYAQIQRARPAGDPGAGPPPGGNVRTGDRGAGGDAGGETGGI
ncbi:MAG TPA: hypothetical protein VFT22_00650, partial [Kofleriaceae bacterium]|nr:hypothetical protein [Kofleriaceae bacterium]